MACIYSRVYPLLSIVYKYVLCMHACTYDVRRVGVYIVMYYY